MTGRIGTMADKVKRWTVLRRFVDEGDEEDG